MCVCLYIYIYIYLFVFFIKRKESSPHSEQECCTKASSRKNTPISPSIYTCENETKQSSGGSDFLLCFGHGVERHYESNSLIAEKASACQNRQMSEALNQIYRVLYIQSIIYIYSAVQWPMWGVRCWETSCDLSYDSHISLGFWVQYL